MHHPLIIRIIPSPYSSSPHHTQGTHHMHRTRRTHPPHHPHHPHGILVTSLWNESSVSFCAGQPSPRMLCSPWIIRILGVYAWSWGAVPLAGFNSLSFSSNECLNGFFSFSVWRYCRTIDVHCHNCSCCEHLDGTTSSEKRWQTIHGSAAHDTNSPHTRVTSFVQIFKMPNKWMKVNNIECSCMANPRTKQQTDNGKKVFDDQRNALPQTMKAGWRTWYNNSPNILITKHAVLMCTCHALWNHAFPLGQFVRSVEVGCPNECSHLHGLWLWITGQLSWPNLFCYIPGFQQSTAVSQCKFHNFTWSSRVSPI